MAERSTQKFARTKNILSEKTYPSTLKTVSAAQNPGNLTDDELIATLSQSYENRRAAQVFEWESIRLGNAFRRESIT